MFYYYICTRWIKTSCFRDTIPPIDNIFDIIIIYWAELFFLVSIFFISQIIFIFKDSFEKKKKTWERTKHVTIGLILLLFLFLIPWINYDYNPAQEPYDIGV